MVLTWCLLASAVSRGDGRHAGRSGGPRMGNSLDSRPLLAGVRPGLREVGGSKFNLGQERLACNRRSRDRRGV